MAAEYYRCKVCGWIGTTPKVLKATINLPHRNYCPQCQPKDVAVDKLPENERPGRCHACGGSKFKLSVKDHTMRRTCQDCGDIITV